MTKNESTIDKQEVEKFAQHAKHWWDLNGPLKTLHDINSTRLEWIMHHVNLSSTRVLDVGCGGGILCEAMARHGAQVTGIDAECTAIQVAADHAKKEKLTIDYLCTPIEEFEDQSFDTITCLELLEHVQNPELILKHCKRLLKPEGILFLSTINRTLMAYASAVLVAEYVLNLLPRQTHDYDKFISPSELSSMARSLDLSLIDLKGMHYNPVSRKASLCADVSVNYLVALKRNSE